jgi:hypothetical protein
MRAVQLLAAGMFCLLIPGLGCGRTVSKVGEYSEQAAIHGGGSAGESFGNGKGNDYAGSGGLATMHGDAGAGGSTMPIASTDGKCTFKSLNAPRHPLDMYVMMDSNITLAVGLWDLTAQGLRMFADDPRSNGLNVGVRYYGTECNASAYEMETVPIDVLPNNAPAIDSSTMQLPLRASQMLPALSGAISHQKKRAPLHPGAKQIVVLITDGITQDFNIVCPPYGVPDLTAAARAGFDNAPSIETYLLTLSTTVPGADLAARFGMLDQVAAAGGTGSAI